MPSKWCLLTKRNRFPVADLGGVGHLGVAVAIQTTWETTRRQLAAPRHRLRPRNTLLLRKAAVNGDEDNLLVILGQFVSHFVSARISDVSGILIHRFCIRKNMLYQLCISDVSAMYQ